MTAQEKAIIHGVLRAT